jgi:predicted ATPase/class 3 adenylate cyclase
VEGVGSSRSEDRNRPVGNVTFLFTDLEGSTRLWEEQPAAMETALAIHDARLRAAIEHHGGYVFTTAGDSFAVAFHSAEDAAAAAIDSQRALATPCGALTLRIRMGLHSGAASLRDGDYFGSVVNRCARLMSAGHGGQILVSAATRSLLDIDLDGAVELVDLGEHRLKDLREPEHIFELRHPDLPAGFPPLRTIEEFGSNLPIQLTEFVGRSTEISEVHQLLERHRLVTLTGSGGGGKTRLALQVAAESLEAHPGGTVLVELAAITDPQVVADEIAERVGAEPGPDTTPVSAAANRIGDRHMLLLLDNCEHVIDSVAESVDDLLRMCPSLRVLATSQQALDVAGEARYLVPSLGLPNRSDTAGAEHSDAVQLFCARAVAARSDFALGDDNIGAVVSICRQLGGIPLALELAAARVRMLSPAQISDRLDDRFRLLRVSGRGSAPRHQSLQAAMDWSYDLLPAVEQAVFRKLSVFAGNFSVEAAETVCEHDPAERVSVLEQLTALVDKSLVIPEHAPQETRYRLLDSVRAYGAEQLVQAGEAAATRARHWAYYLEVAEGLYVQRRSGELGAAIDGLSRDEDNIRKALRSTLDDGELESAARIIGAIGHLWYLEGVFREGIEWCREFFDADPDLSNEMLARPLHVYGTLLGSWKQPQAGAEMLRREADLLRGLDEPERLGSALNNLGNLLNDMGEADEAEASLLEAVEQFRLAGRSTALAVLSLGFGYFQTGRYDEASDMYSQALAEAAAEGNEYIIALTTASVGHVAVVSGDDLGVARERLVTSREKFTTIGVIPGIALCEQALGQLEREAGDIRAAANHLHQALEEPDAHWYLATKYWILQLVAGMVDDPHLARQLLRTSEDYYSGCIAPQPVWVRDDLIRTRRRWGLVVEETSTDNPLHGSDVDAVIELARAALDRLRAR